MKKKQAKHPPVRPALPPRMSRSLLRGGQLPRVKPSEDNWDSMTMASMFLGVCIVCPYLKDSQPFRDAVSGDVIRTDVQHGGLRQRRQHFVRGLYDDVGSTGKSIWWKSRMEFEVGSVCVIYDQRNAKIMTDIRNPYTEHLRIETTIVSVICP